MLGRKEPEISSRGGEAKLFLRLFCAFQAESEILPVRSDAVELRSSKLNTLQEGARNLIARGPSEDGECLTTNH
jgi:hypothetical protein